MCSCTHYALLAHMLGLALGIMFLAELVRRRAMGRMFWIAAGVASLAMAAFTLHVSEPLAIFDDFIAAYWVAGGAALKSTGAIVGLYGDGVTGFVNLPVLAYAFAPFAVLPPWPAALLFTGLGILAALAAWRLLHRAAGLDGSDSALLLFLFAAFGPLAYSIREGNTSHIVLMLLAWALLLLRERRDLLAGVALGIAALVKLPLLLFGIYFALRGRWLAVAGGAAAVGLAVLASFAIFGWDAHVQWYLTSIAPFARDPIPAMNAQSIASAIARLQLGPGSVLDWSPHQLPPTLRLVPTALLILLIALAIGATLFSRPKAARPVPQDVAEETEYLIVLILCCVASTLSWSHYYTWMLIPAAFFVGRTRHFAVTLTVRILGWAAIVLAAIPVARLRFDNALVEELNARVGTSHLLAGGLLMLGLLIWSRWHMAQPAGGVDGPDIEGRNDADPQFAADRSRIAHPGP